MNSLRIGIAGAGLLGRLAAWTLTRQGHEVSVFDPAPDAGPRHDGQGAAGFTAAGMLSPVAELDRDGPGRRWWFAGDTDVYEEMQELAPVDLALVPVWGWGPTLGDGHMDPVAAARAVALVRARRAVPIHWGTYFPTGLSGRYADKLRDPPHEFARWAAELAPACEVTVVQPGGRIAVAG